MTPNGLKRPGSRPGTLPRKQKDENCDRNRDDAGERDPGGQLVGEAAHAFRPAISCYGSGFFAGGCRATVKILGHSPGDIAAPLLRFGHEDHGQSGVRGRVPRSRHVGIRVWIRQCSPPGRGDASIRVRHPVAVPLLCAAGLAVAAAPMLPARTGAEPGGAMAAGGFGDGLRGQIVESAHPGHAAFKRQPEPARPTPPPHARRRGWT